MWFKNMFKNLFEQNEKEVKEMDQEKEVWKTVPGASKYEASNLGKVRKKDKNGKWKDIAYFDKDYYKVELLLDNGKRYKTTRARIIAQTFELYNPRGRKNLIRIDGNKLNDRLDNLSYEEEVEKRGIEEMKENNYQRGIEKLKANEEMFIDMKGASNYSISNMGNIIDKKTGKEIVQHIVGKNRDTKCVYLIVNGKGITTSVAKLVAESFEIPNPQNTKISYHIGDSLNNRLDNITYDRKYNPSLKRTDIKKEVEYSDKKRIDNELVNNKNKPLNEEIWKWIKGYERWYEVSNLGNVRKTNDDGSKKVLVACNARPNYNRGRIVNLRKAEESQKTYQICKLVAEAFNLPNKDNSTVLYHIDGDINNDCLTNLTYDETETEKYLEEQRKKEEQERLENEKQEHQLELFNYIENNKDFLTQTKEMNKEVTIKDVYNKLCEILEVLKNERNIH